MERFYSLGPNQTFVEVKVPAFNYREAFEAAKAALNPTLVAAKAKRFGDSFEACANSLAEYQADKLQDEHYAAFRAAWFGTT